MNLGQKSFLMTGLVLRSFTCGWGFDPNTERSVAMVTNPRYSCRSAPKQVCWWHHQIRHLPCCPCSLSRRQLAEWGRPLALLSGCVRYSRLLTGMSALCCLLPVHKATHRYRTALTSTLQPWQKLNCIPASLQSLCRFGFYFLFLLFLFSACGGIRFAIISVIITHDGCTSRNTVVPQMPRTEITETDFKPTFVLSVVHRAVCVFCRSVKSWHECWSGAIHHVDVDK